MLALSVTQPWASLIMAGLKRYETRGWRRAVAGRGRIAIHATKEDTYITTGDLKYLAHASGLDMVLALDYPVGAILGTIELVRSWRTEDVRSGLSPAEVAFGDYSNKRFAFELAPASRFLLEKPIPCPGRLGFWPLPNEIAELIKGLTMGGCPGGCPR